MFTQKCHGQFQSFQNLVIPNYLFLFTIKHRLGNKFQNFNVGLIEHEFSFVSVNIG